MVGAGGAAVGGRALVVVVGSGRVEASLAGVAAGAGANVVWHGELDREVGGVGEVERVAVEVAGLVEGRCCVNARYG